ncbi:hypothetical protein BDQ12DRAFT_227292 [Crucibulum laeve]|uniref:Uncharacterized protein n=1 Tax=Crucibulum laeve TaxID=68775 RepID=A0A5C3M6U4_9AGAR|nr:hypothetical protein BDQ12DRAFT_227292 [Crucibulum laeve]
MLRSINSPFLSHHDQPSSNPRRSLASSQSTSSYITADSYLHNTPHHHRSHRERLNDPAASMLDLDDDPRSSYAPSELYQDQSRSSDDENDQEDDDSLPRMSMLGPKMRFHSRAPWEMDDTSLREEEEEEEEASHSIFSSVIFTRAKEKDSGGKSSGSGSSGSPRVSNASRPSGESSRSQLFPKRSFETTSSKISYPRGALYTLAQESMSATSLAQPAYQDGHRGKFSLGRIRSQSPSISIPASPVMSSRSPIHGRCPPDTDTPSPSDREEVHPMPLESRLNTNINIGRASPPSDDDVHPYANPDLVISYASELPPPSPLRSTMRYPGVTRSDSSVTVTESSTGNPITRTTTGSTLTTETSHHSSTKRRVSSIQGKDISSPMSVQGTAISSHMSIHSNDSRMSSLLPGANSLPGWTEHGAPPAFGLISLEEARAQRSRGSALHTTLSRTSIATAASGSSTMPFPNKEQDDASIINGSDPSVQDGLMTRTRARSISAGKAKSALQAIVGPPKLDRRGSEPAVTLSQNAAPGKTLKHKKSGFMRLLGRSSDKEEAPPVPSLDDAYTAHNAQNALRPPRTSSHRVPAPSLSPSSPDSVYSLNTSPLSPIPSPKRVPPSLSINTHTQGAIPRPPNTSSSGQTSYQVLQTLPSSDSVKPWLNDNFPQSAPANVSEFPSLKLRPVSTLFSAQFGDHIVSSDLQPTLEADLDTPRSQSPIGIISPITPGSFYRSSNDHPSVTAAAATGDQSSVIKALQEELSSSKNRWQAQKWELESQVRDLKAQVEELKSNTSPQDYCDVCGHGSQYVAQDDTQVDNYAQRSVVNRPRLRTGTSSRFGSALP